MKHANWHLQTVSAVCALCQQYNGVGCIQYLPKPTKMLRQKTFLFRLVKASFDSEPSGRSGEETERVGRQIIRQAIT